MHDKLVVKSMKTTSRKGLDKQRKVILKLIDLHLYPFLDLLGWLRRKQLESK